MLKLVQNKAKQGKTGRRTHNSEAQGFEEIRNICIDQIERQSLHANESSFSSPVA
jgi:hypothetical protein